MNLTQQLNNDLITAMKEKNELVVSVLRILKSQIKNREIAKGATLTEEEIVAEFKKQIKQRRDSAQQFANANRDELAKKENQEIEIIAKYLPKEMPDDQLEKIVDSIIAKMPSPSMAQMGQIIKEVIAQTKGAADNSKTAQLVKSKLQG